MTKPMIVAWEKVFCLIDCGGLGIYDFVTFNTTLSLKFAWDSLARSSPWSFFFLGVTSSYLSILQHLPTVVFLFGEGLSIF